MVFNEVEYKDIKIPKHWKLSLIFTLDVYNILTREYDSLKEFYGGNDVLKPMLELLTQKHRVIVTLSELTPVYSYITTQKTKMKPIFNFELTRALFEYYFLHTLHSIISILDEHMIIMKTTIRDTMDDDDEIVTDQILEQEMKGEISEIDIIQGESYQKNQVLASYLFKCLTIIEKRKRDVDINHEQIAEKINRAKEKEKDAITSYMKRLDQEAELRVENTFKNLKLEKWSKGLQKD